jgi:uncharacterized membrane protein
MKILQNILSATVLTTILMLIVYFVELISDNPTFKILNWKGFLLLSALTFTYLMWKKDNKQENI